MKLFKFSKKKNDLDDNFLSLSDKEEISKISQEKEKYLRTAQKLDQEIIQIQKSTKTLIPNFTPMHNNLRRKYKWYYLWHLKKFANLTHWLILLLFIFSLPLIFANFSGFQNKRAQATGYDFPRWEWSNPSPIGNFLYKTTTCSDGSVWTVGDSGTILKSTNYGNQWTQEYTGVSSFLSDIVCLSPSNIIVVGDVILQYNGISWTQRTIGTSLGLNSITALDSTHLIAVGPPSTITVSTDAGQTWVTKASGTLEVLLSVVALDSTHAVAVGEDGALTVSSDAGQTWTTKNSDIGFNTLNDVVALDSTHAIAVGNSGKITVSTDAGQTWTAKASGTGNFLSDITALDSTHAIAVGGSGTITVSTDVGQTWATKVSGTGNGLTSVIIFDSTHAIAVGVSGTITVSTDAGQTWNTKASGTSNFLETIIAIDDNHLVVVGESGTITVSTDAGQTWILKSDGTVIDLSQTAVLDTNNVVAVGSSGVITVSTDAGQTWNTKDSGTLNYLVSVTILDSTHIIAVGVSGTITVSTDAGQTWATKNSDTINALYDVTALDANNIVAVGSSGTITVSTDAGQTWATKASGVGGVQLNSITSLDSTHAIAVGSSGKITVSTDAGQTWVAKTSETTNILMSVIALDSNHAVAVGYSGTITVSTDAGQTWATKVSGTGNGLYDVAVLDSTHITAIGIGGMITVSSDSGNTWTVQSSITSQDLTGSIAVLSTYQRYLVSGTGGTILLYHSPANATATKMLVKLSGQDDFSDGNPITGTPTAVRAGDTVTATLYATDGSNVLDKGNASWVGFTTTDPNDTNPGVIQLTQGILGTPDSCIQNPTTPTTYWCGRGTANFVFHTPGTWTVTAADVYGVLSSVTSSSITVTPGSVDSLYFSSLPSSLSMGSASGAVTVGVKDAFGNNTTVSGNKTIRLTTSSSGGRFATSANGPWTQGSLDTAIANGQGSTSFYYLDFATGSATITASEQPDEGWTDASGAITITSGSLDQSTLTVDKSSVAPGESLTATVTLKNSQGLALASRTVQLLSSRSTDRISSSIITNSSGSGSFTVTPTEAGDLTLTAYDQTDNAYVPQTAGVHVGIGALARIDFTAESSSVNAGKNLPIYLTLYDSYSNVLSDFSGEVSFSSSDEKASFSHSTYNLTAADQGKYSQDVTLNTQGDQSITASIGQIQDTVGIKVLGETEAIPTTTTSTSPTPTSSPIAAPQTLIEKIAESPVAQQIAKTLTPVATAAAALGFLPLLIQAFPQTFHAFASLFPALFAAAAFRRRRKPWGTVFDSLTGKPIELAVVRIFNDNTDKLVATKVTDQNGRFNILVEKGTYYLKVAKPGYLFPARMSKIKAGQLATRFGPETDIYLGQSFVVNTANANINLNVALDPKPNTLSNANRVRKVVKDSLDWFFIGISYVALPMLIIGAVFTALALIIKPTGFNLTLGIIYVLLLVGFLVVKRIRQTQLGLVFDGKTKKPIKNAVVSCFDKEYNALRETRTTDQNGYFSILAPKGEYYLTIDAKGYRFPSKELEGKKEDKILGKLYFGDTIRNKKSGYLKVSIPLDKKY